MENNSVALEPKCAQTVLIKLTEPMAMAHYVNLTKRIWYGLRDDDVLLLWRMIKLYYQNGFRDGITIPPEIAEPWSRSKQIIDKEIRDETRVHH